MHSYHWQLAAATVVAGPFLRLGPTQKVHPAHYLAFRPQAVEPDTFSLFLFHSMAICWDKCGNILPKVEIQAARAQESRLTRFEAPGNPLIFQGLGAKGKRTIERARMSVGSLRSLSRRLVSALLISDNEIAKMKDSSQPSLCICRCTAQVPPELIAVRLCVLHFTQSIERTCTQMHRQIALDGANAERKAEAAIYINESALLLARLTGNLCLSDELKRRVLSTFLSLMNLRENLERAARCQPDLRLQKSSVALARSLAAMST